MQIDIATFVSLLYGPMNWAYTKDKPVRVSSNSLKQNTTEVNNISGAHR